VIAGRRGLGRAPGVASIGGGAHVKQIAHIRIVPLDVAIAVIRAGRTVVAPDPVLVGILILDDVDGIIPVNGVGGAADRDRIVVADRQGADQPLAILSIVGDSGV